MTREPGTQITLEKDLLIGRGRDRACYRHPDDPGKCIKVSIVENDKQSRREPRYYSALQSRHINWDAIARYWGKISTNLGEGLVFDLVLDFDQSISRPFTYYLDNKLVSQKQVSNLLRRMKHYLHDNRIISRDISANNLLYRRDSDSDGKLVIIDGLGNNELIPLSNFIGPLAHRKISRKWTKLIDKLKKDFPAYQYDQ